MGWSDLDWGGDLDTRHSTSSFVFLMGGGAISWQSRKQTSVALSSTEGEFVTATTTTKEGVWLQKLLEELGVTRAPKQILLHIDNQSCITLIKTPRHHEKTKHVDYKYHYIKELAEEGSLQLQYTPTQRMWAAMLIKSVPRKKHEDCCQALGLDSG